MGVKKLEEILKLIEFCSGKETKLNDLPKDLRNQRLKETGFKTLYDLNIDTYLGGVLSSMKIFTLSDLVKSEEKLKARPWAYEETKLFLQENGYDFNMVVPIELQYKDINPSIQQLANDLRFKTAILNEAENELAELEKKVKGLRDFILISQEEIENLKTKINSDNERIK